jgi:transposase
MPVTATSPCLSVKRLDHLGLVAGMCKELKIAETIDAILPKNNNHHVSHGQALVAMILNGLGFHGRTLHMFPNFFKHRPTERLIAPGILPEHLNDDVLGRGLDTFYNADVSVLYQVLSERVVDHLALQGDAVHLDITSFHVDGNYHCDADDDSGKIKLVQGYSRDHRPELNQVVLELICENQAGIPVFMQALSGNTNDSKAFETVTRQHIDSLKAAQNSRYFVGDAALYTEGSIRTLHQKQQLFVSRVPMTIKEAKQTVKDFDASALTSLDKGYSAYWHDSNYGGVPQKWLVVHSNQACKREHKTLEKNLLKNSTKELKAFQKLTKKRFSCQNDAAQALATFQKTLRWTHVEEQSFTTFPIYAGKGRPKKEQSPERHEYGIEGIIATTLARVEEAKAQKGIFILATNDGSEELKMQDLLETYKSQQSVERGFRFLKSPEFMTSSLFLKKAERIEALLMVMTCSLMVYAALEHRIRKELVAQNKHFPDMKNKPTQRPTARWVFLKFEGLNEVQLSEHPIMIPDINEHQQIIINILGKSYMQIYS